MGGSLGEGSGKTGNRQRDSNQVRLESEGEVVILATLFQGEDEVAKPLESGERLTEENR